MTRLFNHAVLSRTIDDQERTIALIARGIEKLQSDLAAQPEGSALALHIQSLIDGETARKTEKMDQVKIWKAALADPRRTRQPKGV